MEGHILGLKYFKRSTHYWAELNKKKKAFYLFSTRLCECKSWQDLNVFGEYDLEDRQFKLALRAGKAIYKSSTKPIGYFTYLHILHFIVQFISD